MNITLEKKVLGYMLNHIEPVKRTPLQSNWFSEQMHRELAYVLLKTDKEFTDFSELELEVKSYYPKTHVNEEWMHLTRYEDMFVSDLKASVQSLKEEYVKDKVHDAVVHYAQYPTDKNKEAMQDWLRTMDELEIEEDTGQLEQPINDIIHELDNEVEPGLLSYPRLDKVLGAGLEGGMLFILAGRPGMGKTAYAINVAIQMLQRQPDVQIDFFTLEMTKTVMTKRIISRLTDINSYKFKNTKNMLDDDEKRQVIRSADWLKDTGLRIHDSRFKLKEIERMIRQRHHEHRDGQYIAIIDYVSLIDVGGSRQEQRYREVGKISRTFKLLTNELDIPILLLSQLNRGVEARQDKTPVLSDLRESGDLEQDANVVGLLSEDEEMDHVINLNIAKNREGATAMIPYEFYKPSSNFRELDRYES